MGNQNSREENQEYVACVWFGGENLVKLEGPDPKPILAPIRALNFDYHDQDSHWRNLVVARRAFWIQKVASSRSEKLSYSLEGVNFAYVSNLLAYT